VLTRPSIKVDNNDELFPYEPFSQERERQQAGSSCQQAGIPPTREDSLRGAINRAEPRAAKIDARERSILGPSQQKNEH